MHDYTVDLNWTGRRRGEISSPELDAHIKIATPPEFPEGEAGLWSPEHLFTAAVNSCFMSTFLAIADFSKLSYRDFTCRSTGKLEQVEGKFKMTGIELRPVLKLNSISDKALALKVLQKADKACLISNSINSTVVMLPEIN
jgi:peroxiredoxin-like protein